VGYALGLKVNIKKMTLKGYRRPYLGKLGFNGLVILVLLLMGLLVVSQATSDAEPGYVLSGPVIRVADGDTITVRVGSENHRIRLASIDAPETGSGSKRPGQPYAQASRRFLADRVAGKTVSLQCYELDRYGRDICDVMLDGPYNANQLLVKEGMAWAYRQGNDRFLRDPSLIELEQDARENKRGLWAEPNPIEPWVWRIECWRQGRCEQ
jgi:endonuclease YncB( thermonuclease family)